MFPMWRGGTKRVAEDVTSHVSDPLEKWEHFAESVEVPLSMFSGACAEKDISFVGVSNFINYPVNNCSSGNL